MTIKEMIINKLLGRKLKAYEITTRWVYRIGDEYVDVFHIREIMFCWCCGAGAIDRDINSIKSRLCDSGNKNIVGGDYECAYAHATEVGIKKV